MATNLVQCGDHSLAPSSIVCIHLVQSTAHEWVRVPPGDGIEGDGDWVCPRCAERFDDLSVKDLVVVCMHCARAKREGGTVVGELKRASIHEQK
jgi:hypothetical protein